MPQGVYCTVYECKHNKVGECHADELNISYMQVCETFETEAKNEEPPT